MAYQTAWLKAHYPVEYMSALLTSVKDNKDKTAVYLGRVPRHGDRRARARRQPLGGRVRARSATGANRRRAAAAARGVADGGSGWPEAAEGPMAEPRAIVFGLAAVRNVGESLVERIVAEREANGPFEDIFDFCCRVDPVVLEQAHHGVARQGGRLRLARPPAPGAVPGPRGGGRPDARAPPGAGPRHHDALRRLRGGGQADPGWGGAKVAIPETEFDKAQRLAFEKEMLGLYVSDHPLMGFEAALSRHTDSTLSDMREEDVVAGDRSPVRTVGGVVTDLRRSYTKKGDLMARFVLEDLQAAMEVFVFPKTMAEYGALIENDAIVVVKGRLDTREEEPKIVCMEVSRPLLDRGQSDLHIKLPLGVLTDAQGRGPQGGPERPPGPSPVLAPRRGEGAAAAARVQRRLPQRARRRAQAAARAERRAVLNRVTPARRNSASELGMTRSEWRRPHPARGPYRLGRLGAEPVD